MTRFGLWSFYRGVLYTTTCTRQPLLTGPMSGCLMQFWEIRKCGLFLFPVWFKVFSINFRIARAFNRSGATQAVVLDISRAFDRVWHAGLLHKLWRSSFDKKKPNSKLLFIVLFLGIISWKGASCFNGGASFYPSTFVYTRSFP